MGGTSLLKPLQKALDMNPPEEFTKQANYKKMIFVLTDGATDDSQKCLEAAKNHNEDSAIHTFGIGNDCDQKFCIQLAQNGDGLSVILGNSQVSQLRSKVVETLAKTILPSLRDVKT